MERRNFLALCATVGASGSAESLFAQAAQTPSGTNLPANAGKPEPLVVRPREARVYSQGLGEAHILVGGERSGGAWWLGRFREDPGFMTLLHLHHHMDEQFFVLEGVLSLFFAGTWHDLEPGTFAVVPRATPHAQGNTSKNPVHFLGSGSPAGFELFFADLDQLVRRVPPSDPQFGAEIAKLLPRYDTQPLGPPPRKA